MAGTAGRLCRAFISLKHISYGNNAVTANTAKCPNLPNFIQNKNNAIRCSSSWIGSIWLLLEPTIAVLQVRPHTMGCSANVCLPRDGLWHPRGSWDPWDEGVHLQPCPSKGATQSLEFRLGAQITLHTQTLPAKGFLMHLFQQHNSIQLIISFETFVEQQEQEEGSLNFFVSHFPYLPPIFLICDYKTKFKPKYTSAWENQINSWGKPNFLLTNKNWSQYQKSDWYWNVAWSTY